MPIALSWAGYQYKPWPDIIQWSMPDQPNVTEYAFEHYSRGVKGGKPEYKSALEGWREELLCGKFETVSISFFSNLARTFLLS